MASRCSLAVRISFGHQPSCSQWRFQAWPGLWAFGSICHIKRSNRHGEKSSITSPLLARGKSFLEIRFQRGQVQSHIAQSIRQWYFLVWLCKFIGDRSTRTIVALGFDSRRCEWHSNLVWCLLQSFEWGWSMPKRGTTRRRLSSPILIFWRSNTEEWN